MDDAAPPLLLFVVGPPAAGKMSVGQAIAVRTGLRLFHNHISIEVALRYFVYGTPAFSRISGGIRRLVLEEVAASDLPGLVFTFVWAFNVPEDEAFLDEYATPFRERGGRVLFVELEATQAERLKRNECGSRLAEKPSKRDLEASRRRLLANDARYQLNSGGKFDQRPDYLRIDNTLLSPGEVAERVISHFGLPGAPGFMLLSGVVGGRRLRRAVIAVIVGRLGRRSGVLDVIVFRRGRSAARTAHGDARRAGCLNRSYRWDACWRAECVCRSGGWRLPLDLIISGPARRASCCYLGGNGPRR
jgi:hypothetical protein